MGQLPIVPLNVKKRASIGFLKESNLQTLLLKHTKGTSSPSSLSTECQTYFECYIVRGYQLSCPSHFSSGHINMVLNFSWRPAMHLPALLSIWAISAVSLQWSRWMEEGHSSEFQAIHWGLWECKLFTFNANPFYLLMRRSILGASSGS